ncbi:hypothetical protein [Mycolicibacterium sp. P1-5]|uniref:hypothetical protein n=1 Tax=Mycolicibacterium sp. P1-5 TaxID=2024617 RepID=UPI0011EF2B8C|nr:hypothetical protein [Mycolicibacterium sp. P1-5]KAA0105173.1 hypothetical protein CIW47_20540 [Mycolicibacterium sp. P1-5]
MTVSVRSYLTAGMAAAVVGTVAIAPVQPSTRTAVSVDALRLAAAVEPQVSQVNTAAAVLGQAGPVTVAQQPLAQASPTANNNASDAIDSAYNVIMYWADYWANDLGPYLLGWVPFGYLISDQIQIWYNTFTVPVSYSFVYDFLDPVVNDFWNPTVWRDGLTALAQTTFSSFGATVNQEIAYFISLQWFPIPLPPIPPLPFAALKTPAAAASADAAVVKQAETPTAKSGTGHSARTQVDKQAADAVDNATVAADTVTDTTQSPVSPTLKTTAATKSAKDDTATTAGKAGSTKTGADADADAGKKKSTAGSARSHGAKSAQGGG